MHVFCTSRRYDILNAVNQLARAMPKPAKAQMGAAMYLLRYLVASTDFSITYKQGGFRIGSFSDANWGNNPDKWLVYAIIHRDGGQRPDQFQGGTARTDRTVHDGGRARGGSYGNEGGGVLLQHNVGAGLR